MSFFPTFQLPKSHTIQNTCLFYFSLFLLDSLLVYLSLHPLDSPRCKEVIWRVWEGDEETKQASPESIYWKEEARTHVFPNCNGACIYLLDSSAMSPLKLSLKYVYVDNLKSETYHVTLKTWIVIHSVIIERKSTSKAVWGYWSSLPQRIFHLIKMKNNLEYL